MDVLKLLLSKGASAGAADEREGRTPLHFAAFGNETATAEVLIRHGAEVDAVDHHGFTPLHVAASQGSAGVAALLLKHKADPNARTSAPVGASMYLMAARYAAAGNSPLHLAALSGQTNVMGLLLKAGALVNATNSAGRTALDLASQPGGFPGMTRLQRGFPTRSEPPGVGESARPAPFGSWIEGQRAAARLLEQSGGKRSMARQPSAAPYLDAPRSSTDALLPRGAG